MKNLHSFINPKEFGVHFSSEEFEMIYNQTTTDFQNLVSLEQFKEIAISFNQGNSNYHLEFCTNMQKLTHYVWLDQQKEKAISVTFDEKFVIHSLYLKAYVTYPETDNLYTKNSYIMPINSEWFVFWGGNNEFINYHYAYENQRYAYDLLQVKNGLSYKDNPLRNENYHAFNEEILAPADGKVVIVVDGIEDNVPGEMDPNNPAGNYVIIEHKHQEYSMLAHFKQDSILVSKGETVTQGQCIGLCGNSGNSSEPHVHFQIIDSTDFIKGKSIRIQFQDGKEPIQGDLVSNKKSASAPV